MVYIKYHVIKTQQKCARWQYIFEHNSARDSANADDSHHVAVARSDVAVPVLTPCSNSPYRDDGKQRRRLRIHLAQPQDQRQRRHEQDSAADAQEAAHDASGQTERCCSDDLSRRHQKMRSIALTTRSTAK